MRSTIKTKYVAGDDGGRKRTRTAEQIVWSIAEERITRIGRIRGGEGW